MLAGLTVNVPLVASVPVHPPLAVHDVAFVLDQVRVELPPGVIVVGLAVRVTVGAVAAAATVTAAVAFFAGSENEIASTATNAGEGTKVGAVYNPVDEIVP